MTVDERKDEQEVDQEAEFKAWDLPYVEDTTQTEDDKSTNAFNRKSNWKYEPPEPEIEILPPTAEEIEGIRAAAHAEGFSQGQQEGYAKGYEEGLAKGQEEGIAQEERRQEGSRGPLPRTGPFQLMTNLLRQPGLYPDCSPWWPNR